tara:strand:+ start:4599 stop:4853 length:255 start_codon:yes stop_codon:yes gene_type:complete
LLEKVLQLAVWQLTQVKASAIKSDSVARLAFKTAIGALFSACLFYTVVSGFCLFSADSLQDTSNKLIDSMIIDSLLNFFIVLFY